MLPREVIDGLQIEPGAKIEVEILSSRDATPYVFDEKRFDEAITKHAGSLREQFLADGWTSVDEYMQEIRPEW